jgi:hypothetical protein
MEREGYMYLTLLEPWGLSPYLIQEATNNYYAHICAHIKIGY